MFITMHVAPRYLGGPKLEPFSKKTVFPEISSPGWFWVFVVKIITDKKNNCPMWDCTHCTYAWCSQG